MTPKEKARELVDKFYAPDSTSLYQDVYRAKGNALICVDEMIKELRDLEKTEHYTYERVSRLEEVKQEINKL